MTTTAESADSIIQVYLLGDVAFDAALLLQRRLRYDVTGDRSQAGLILCEHPPLITIGRQGSRRHLHAEPNELALRGWPVRWVSRGGGCWLHLPGQIAIYPILPLDRLGLTIPVYLMRLCEVIEKVIDDFSIHQPVKSDDAGVWIGNRLVATLGVSVRNDVTLFGTVFNLDADLEWFRAVRCHPRAEEPMTSLVRERRGPVRTAMVRERLVEHFRDTFGFSRVSLFSDHPLVCNKAERDPKRTTKVG